MLRRDWREVEKKGGREILGEINLRRRNGMCEEMAEKRRWTQNAES